MHFGSLDFLLVRRRAVAHPPLCHLGGLHVFGCMVAWCYPHLGIATNSPAAQWPHSRTNTKMAQALSQEQWFLALMLLHHLHRPAVSLSVSDCSAQVQSGAGCLHAHAAQLQLAFAHVLLEQVEHKSCKITILVCTGTSGARHTLTTVCQNVCVFFVIPYPKRWSSLILLVPGHAHPSCPLCAW